MAVHPADCLCDIDLSAHPVTLAAPARNVAAAIVEIATAWGTEGVCAPDLLTAGATSYRDVARRTGVTAYAARKLGAELEAESDAARNLASGGGFKYDGATYERILALRAEGKSYTAIARDVGVNRNAVIGVCRRRVAV